MRGGIARLSLLLLLALSAKSSAAPWREKNVFKVATNLPARLIVTEAKDRVGVSRSDGYATRQDAFVLEWIAFHDAIVSKGAPKTSLADARADLELFAAMIAKMR